MRTLFSFAATLAIPLAASAATIDVYGDTNDRGVDQLGNNSYAMGTINAVEHRVGNSGNSGPRGLTYVVPFKLPALAPGQSFSAADFSVFYRGENAEFNPSFSLDLYIIGVRSDPAVQTTDYGYGGNVATTGKPRVQDNFIVNSLDTTHNDTKDYLQRVHTTNAADTDILNYIISYYSTDSSAAGKYIFFRLNPDGTKSSNYDGYIVASADAVSSDHRPVLSLTTVPEPSTALLAAAAFPMIARRRRATV